MTLLRRIAGRGLAVMLLALMPVAGWAARVPLYQDGTMRPGDLSKFLQNGVTGSVGDINGGTVSGRGVNPFAIEDGSAPGQTTNIPGLGTCWKSDLTNASRLCLGHTEGGIPLIQVDGIGTGVSGGHLVFRLDGVDTDFPGNLVSDILATPEQYGATGGVDDGPALQLWLNAGSAGTALTLMPHTYNTKQCLSLTNPINLTIKGPGAGRATINYTGTPTDCDILNLGSTQGSQTTDMKVSGFRIKSDTVMTAGAGLHVQNTFHTDFVDLVVDGQLGNGKLYHGVWFDQVAVVRYLGGEARAAQDAIRVNGTIDDSGLIADLTVQNVFISHSKNGIHQGGGFGGMYCADGTSMILNETNVRIDTTIVANRNREFFQSPGCILDSATIDSVYIDDNLIGAGTIQLDGWNGGAGRHQINVVHWKDSWLTVNGGPVWAAQQDGIHISDASTIVNVGNPPIRDNGRGGTGWGINCTVVTTNVKLQPGSPGGNNASGDVNLTNCQPTTNLFSSVIGVQNYYFGSGEASFSGALGFNTSNGPRQNMYGNSAGSSARDGAISWLTAGVEKLVLFQGGGLYVGTHAADPAANNMTVEGAFKSRILPVAKTTDYGVVALDSGAYFNNSGAVGTVNFSLPAAAVGLRYCFVVYAAQIVNVVANGSDKVAFGADNGAAGGNISSNTPFSSACVVAPGTGQWIVDATSDKTLWTVH